MNSIKRLISCLLIFGLIMNCLILSFGATLPKDKVKQAVNLRNNNLFYRQFAMLSPSEKSNLLEKIESLRNKNRITKENDPSVYRVLFMGARG